MTEIKLATLNLFNRMGEWERRAPLVIDQLEALAPDTIAFQEVDLDLDQGMWISRQINKRLQERPHYRIKHVASPGKYASVHGLGTLSRLEVAEHEILDLMSYDRTAQRIIFQTDSGRFAFVNTHLHHPPEAVQERLQQLEYLLAWLDRDERKLPTVIAGDFNSYINEPGVAMMKSRFRSAFEAVHGGEPEKTWPTPVNTYDDSPHGTLDYIYVSEEFRILDAGLAFDEPAADDPDLFPSDHLGIYARLEL
ncbi:MAG: endonuclease/exonuclease/phosphatase family protein [Chloroflexi bacterium]|nr:endonuclease/exonuclease/phosphatase family protein [Chloroflexota bacterium]